MRQDEIDARRLKRLREASDLATIRVKIGALRVRDAIRFEQRYNPDWQLQPRIPGGENSAGQWTDGAGGNPSVLSTSTRRTHAPSLSVASNTSENKIVRYISKKLGLTLDEQDRLHRIISKQGYSKEQIENIARDYFSK